MSSSGYKVRAAANAGGVRLPTTAYSFSGTMLNDVMVQATHPNELRTVLNEARLRLGLAAVGTAVAVGEPVSASTFMDIRGGVQ